MAEAIDTAPSDDESFSEFGDRLEAMVKAHAAMLAKTFDSVQIVCTKTYGGGTLVFPWGEGNWFARYGSVREWVLKREEASRVEVRPD